MTRFKISIILTLLSSNLALSQNLDTVKVETLLSLFEYKFSNHFNRDSIDASNLSFSKSTQIRGLTLDLNEQFIRLPFYGYAHSYKKITEEIYWLVTYSEGEVAMNFSIMALNILSGQSTEPQSICYYGGDAGYWHYKYGFIDNNYIYHFIKVNGDEFGTTDSLSNTISYDAMLKVVDGGE